MRPRSSSSPVSCRSSSWKDIIRPWSNEYVVVDIRLQIYQVRWWRRGRAWAEEERFIPDVRLVEQTGGKTALVAEAAGPRPWRHLGSLAIEAFRAWQAVGAEEELFSSAIREAAGRRVRLLESLVAGQPLSSDLRDALAEMLRARVQWLPEESVAFRDAARTKRGRRRHAITMQWGLGSQEPLSMPAVYLSVIHGRKAGLLRSCSRCGDPFLALSRRRGISDKRRRTCDRCRKVSDLSHAQQGVVRRVLDRVRSHYREKDAHRRWRMTNEAKAEFASRRREIMEDLLQMPFEEWRQKYDPPKVGGRGRPRRSREPERGRQGSG